MPVEKSKKGFKNNRPMLEPLNTEIEFQVKGTSHHGLDSYGFIFVGDKGFEFYNYIPRYAFRTKSNGDFAFSSKKPRAVLRACREHVPADRIVRSLSFGEVLKRNTKWLIDKIKGKK